MPLCLALLQKPEMDRGSHPGIGELGPETHFTAWVSLAKLYLWNLQHSFLMCKMTNLGWVLKSPFSNKSIILLTDRRGTCATKPLIRKECSFYTMTHFPRCSDSGSHIQKKKLPNNDVYFWERHSGFMVSALPKGHATAQAEAEGQGHDVGSQVMDQQPGWQPASFTGCRVGGRSPTQGAKLQPQVTPAYTWVGLVVSIKM